MLGKKTERLKIVLEKEEAIEDRKATMQLSKEEVDLEAEEKQSKLAIQLSLQEMCKSHQRFANFEYKKEKENGDGKLLVALADSPAIPALVCMCNLVTSRSSL